MQHPKNPNNHAAAVCLPASTPRVLLQLMVFDATVSVARAMSMHRHTARQRSSWGLHPQSPGLVLKLATVTAVAVVAFLKEGRQCLLGRETVAQTSLPWNP